MPRLAAFDLEIAREIPDHGPWKSAAPLGITCAALALSDQAEPRFFQGAPQMTRAACVALVRELENLVRSGYVLVTWNGTAFDFPVLALESELPVECAELALAHVDLMVIVTFKRGHYLGLQKALDGAGIAGKRQQVQLKDGTQLDGMSGKLAPQLWARGEHDAVLAYLRADVVQLLKLAESVRESGAIRWKSSKGNLHILPVPRLWTVRECFAFDLPDTAWMSVEPPQRAQFVEWMPPLDDVIPRGEYEARELRELPLFAYADEHEYWHAFRRGLTASPALARPIQTYESPLAPGE